MAKLGRIEMGLPNQITISLTDGGIAKLMALTLRHGFNNKAQTIAESISLTDFISEEVNQHGAKVILVYPDGKCEQVIKPELGLKLGL